jgi:hypothetical protein
VYKYRILASSDIASNASTLGIPNPDPLAEHNNTYPNLLELRRRSDFYFILLLIVASFRHFAKNILDKEYPVSNSLFLWKNHFREKRKNY